MRKLTNLIVAALLALAVGACDQAPTGADATEIQPQANSGATTVTDQFTRTFPIPQDPNDNIRACKEGGGFEEIDGTATTHGVLHLTESPSGQVTIKLQLETKGRGVGVETGTVYEGQGSTHLSATFDSKDAAPFNMTFAQTILFVSHGPAPDLILRITRHLTINAEGEVTSEVERIQSECR